MVHHLTHCKDLQDEGYLEEKILRQEALLEMSNIPEEKVEIS